MLAVCVLLPMEACRVNLKPRGAENMLETNGGSTPNFGSRATTGWRVQLLIDSGSTKESWFYLATGWRISIFQCLP